MTATIRHVETSSTYWVDIGYPGIKTGAGYINAARIIITRPEDPWHVVAIAHDGRAPYEINRAGLSDETRDALDEAIREAFATDTRTVR